MSLSKIISLTFVLLILVHVPVNAQSFEATKQASYVAGACQVISKIKPNDATQDNLISASFCIGYFQALQEAGWPKTCAPASMSSEFAMNNFVSWMLVHKEDANYPVFDEVIKSIDSLYPCFK